MQVEKTWFVSNFLIASGAYTWPWEAGTSTNDAEFLTWSRSGCVILGQVLKLSVLVFCCLEVGVHGINAHEFEQTLGVGDGRGGLARRSPWGHRLGHD